MIKKIFCKIYAWLHGESWLQTFIDKEIMTRLDILYKGFKIYGGYTFANRQQFYMYLLIQGLEIMEKVYKNMKEEDQDTIEYVDLKDLTDVH